MDFKELRYLQKKERDNKSLQNVGDDFYKEIKLFLNPSSEINIHLARSMKICAKDILRIRFHKIVRNSMTCIDTNNVPDYLNMTETEIQLINECIALFEKWCIHNDKKN